MYMSTKCIIVLSILVNLTFSQVYAAESWWDKGASILGVDKDVQGTSVEPGAPGIGEIGDAFKQALHIASDKVVAQLGGVDGFNSDPEIHIPLPKKLKKAKKLLKKIGMSSYAEELELKLNRAAETATPKAKQLFWDAIQEMTFEDVKTIYNGPDDSATRYFQKKMFESLSDEMRPIVDQSLSEVGAIRSFDAFMTKYQNLPFVSDLDIDLGEHVVKKGMEGIFYYMAVEERAIRKDPLKQTTALLKKVFGALK